MPRYRRQPTDRPRIYLLRDEHYTLAEIHAPDGHTVTAADVTSMMKPRRPAWLVRMEQAVNERIREVWPR